MCTPISSGAYQFRRLSVPALVIMDIHSNTSFSGMASLGVVKESIAVTDGVGSTARLVLSPTHVSRSVVDFVALRDVFFSEANAL